jgi:hypothetical protein
MTLTIIAGQINCLVHEMPNTTTDLVTGFSGNKKGGRSAFFVARQK